MRLTAPAHADGSVGGAYKNQLDSTCEARIELNLGDDSNHLC